MTSEEWKAILRGAVVAAGGAAVAYFQTAGTEFKPQILITVAVSAGASVVINAVRKKWNLF